MPSLNDLQISLFDEEQVEYLILCIPSLEYLNNIPVDRSELRATQSSYFSG